MIRNSFFAASVRGSLSITAMLALAACGAASGTETDSASRASALATEAASCPPGTLQNPDTLQCAAVVDQRARAGRARSKLPPSLETLRATRARGPERKQSLAENPDHVPGGIGAGVTYKSGALRVTSSVTLYTHMIVYPNGLGFDVPADLFTTATNRTEKGVEVVGWYREAGVHHIGVFDWSCTPENPCVGGQIQPSWIWTRPLGDNACQLTEMADVTGARHQSMYYANTTVSIAGGWENRVSFWNYCTNQWDNEYVHAYTGTQQDCSATGCGWWGPIIENFSPLEDQPLPQLGFIDTRLVHDGVTSRLPASETDFNGPPATWDLCFIDPNTSWSTSQIPCGASTTAWTASLTVNSDWGTGYCGQVTVHNGGTSTIPTWTVSLTMNQSTLGNTYSANFQSTSAGHYQVTPLSWNSSLAPNASALFGFCANKTGTNYLATVSTP